MKKLLLNIYYFGNLPKDRIEVHQEAIRSTEWEAVEDFIPEGSKFLDVGCGAGYAMRKAKENKGCEVFGIDPDPGAHGVGRYSDDSTEGLNIVKGSAEELPYPDQTFDVVYCSHVLEHVEDESKSLQEMKRVLKDDGTLIIGMPTSNMAWLNLWTEVLFTTHHRLFNVLFGWTKLVTTGKTKLINAFVPPSHSAHRAQTVCFDLRYYRISNWKKIVSQEFEVQHELKPAYYPYPQYRQLFKLKKNARKTSSVFFVCHKP